MAPPQEPDLALPTVRLLAAQVVTAAVMVTVWAGIGSLLGNVPFHVASAMLGVTAVTVAAVVTTLIGMPWMPKPASTAMLAWLACTMLRMLASPGVLLLLYSAPLAGRWPQLSAELVEELATAKASALLALATTFLVGLLVEVGVISRHLRQTDRPESVSSSQPQS